MVSSGNSGVVGDNEPLTSFLVTQRESSAVCSAEWVVPSELGREVRIPYRSIPTVEHRDHTSVIQNITAHKTFTFSSSVSEYNLYSHAIFSF